jgi:hypothetical protein
MFRMHILADIFNAGHKRAESARSLSSAFVHQALLPRPIHSNLPGVEPGLMGR